MPLCVKEYLNCRFVEYLSIINKGFYMVVSIPHKIRVDLDKDRVNPIFMIGMEYA